MNDHVDVVLLNPPFYRFFGSHNDKMPLSLAYLSQYLERESISHVLYNADYTGSSLYWSLRWMCDHYDTYVDAVNGKGSLFGEVIEHVLSFGPKAVVLMGGEPLIATTEWGNPFIASHFSDRLRQYGIHTIGVGPFFSLEPDRFAPHFDCILSGEPSSAIVGALAPGSRGILPFATMELDVIPDLDHMFPADQSTNLAMTSFGCQFGCSFCLNAKLYDRLDTPVRFVEPEVVKKDLDRRKATDIYLADLNLPVASIERLQRLCASLTSLTPRRTFTIESRVDCIDEVRADLLKEMGVRAVKLGVESLKQTQLDSWNKKITIDQTEKAMSRLKDRGIGVIIYLFIDRGVTEKDFELTAEFITRWKPEFIVPNINAYDLSSDYRYDTEFSPLRLEELGISRDLFDRFLDLQSQMNPTVGRLIPWRPT
jgi:anaerobic magnesium-protoporphyrin IX monomethyl ester cyclase